MLSLLLCHLILCVLVPLKCSLCCPLRFSPPYYSLSSLFLLLRSPSRWSFSYPSISNHLWESTGRTYMKCMRWAYMQSKRTASNLTKPFKMLPKEYESYFIFNLSISSSFIFHFHFVYFHLPTFVLLNYCLICLFLGSAGQTVEYAFGTFLC